MKRVSPHEVFLLVVLLILLGMGTVMQVSIGDAQGLDRGSVFLRWAALALGVGFVVRVIPYKFIVRNGAIIYLGVLGLLALVPIVGHVVFNARRWIVIGGVSFQPSEPMKIAFVIFMARLLRHERSVKRLRSLVAPGIALALPLSLILSQPDLGTSLLFIPTALAMLFVAGIGRREILVILLGGLLLGGVGYSALRPYQKERIVSTFLRERLTRAERAREGYQLEQSLRSVAVGGVFGQGLGEGIQNRLNRLPSRHNDFVFAVIAEELGLVGAAFLMGAFLLLLLTILRIAQRTRDPQGRLLCTGLGTLFGFQAFVHIGVNLGIVPTTGMTLPFVSAGGTSLCVSVAGLALAASVARHPSRVLSGSILREQLGRLRLVLGSRSGRSSHPPRLQGGKPMVDSSSLAETRNGKGAWTETSHRGSRPATSSR
ncbi:MAG TPA: FtsW/RodA/SpoVE family cell cycle protein [Planctomycetes bacterium]|nr:FtsW/RodA/SpoVE family cell cycle protein [Planctomycetota bacterium]